MKGYRRAFAVLLLLGFTGCNPFIPSSKPLPPPPQPVQQAAVPSR